MVKFTNLISKETVNKLKFCEFFFKTKKEKTIKESISFNVANIFYLKGTWRGLGHSKSIRRTLVGHLGARRTPRALEGDLEDTRSSEENLSNQELGHSGTGRALRHSRHSGIWGTLFYRLLFDTLCLRINGVVLFKMHDTFILREFMCLYSFNIRFV